MDTAEFRRVLDSGAGGRLLAVRRVYYEVGGALDRSEGALEITTAAGVVVLDADEEDDGLAATPGVWSDDLADLSGQDDFATRAGRWVAVDAADEAWATGLVGTELATYDVEGDAFGVTGAVLRFGGGAVRAYVEDGELLVAATS